MNGSKSVRNLTQGKISSQILFFAIPVIIGNLLQELYNVVDTLIVGQTLGEIKLAAVGSTSSLNFFALGFFIGLSAGCSVITSQHFGANDMERVKKSVAAHIIIGVVSAVVLTVCADVNRFHKYCELRGAVAGYNNFLWFQVSTVDATICSQAMVTAAESMGLGACFLGTVTYMAQPIAELLALPKHVIPVTTITLGYPAECPPLTERLPLEAVVHEEQYQDYDARRLETLYSDFEKLPQIQGYIKEAKQENLAKVFTEVRYTREDALKFSKSYMDFAKQQDMI